MAENGFDWDSLLGALAAYFGSRGENGGTPNFYNAPMTPEDKAWNDRRMAMYDAGGSQQMQATGAAAQQFFSGMPTTASPQFASPMMQGQQFAGGISLPKIDLSRFNFSAPPPGAAPPAPRPDTGTGGADRPREGTPGSQPFAPGNGGVYGGAWGPAGPTGGGPTAGAVGKGIAEWWADYRTRNPDWWKDGAKVALAAAAQQYGPAAAMMVRMFMKGRPQALPAPTRGISDFNPPGTMDANGASPLPKPTRSLTDFDPPGTRDEYGNPPAMPRTPPKDDYWKGATTPYWNNPYGYEPPKVWGQTPGVVRNGRSNRA